MANMNLLMPDSAGPEDDLQTPHRVPIRVLGRAPQYPTAFIRLQGDQSSEPFIQATPHHPEGSTHTYEVQCQDTGYS
jgi:hypothetical protein